MDVPKTDMLHLYRAMKLFKDIVYESPELMNTNEWTVFSIAWNIVDVEDIRKYDYEDTNGG
jgi:hypothetical protein